MQMRYLVDAKYKYYICSFNSWVSIQKNDVENIKDDNINTQIPIKYLRDNSNAHPSLLTITTKKTKLGVEKKEIS